MATKKPVEVSKGFLDEIEDRMEEYVEVTVPYGADLNAQPIFLAVNGETVRVQRGETVSIKRKFAEVLKASIAQELASRRYQMEAQKAALRASANL